MAAYRKAHGNIHHWLRYNHGKATGCSNRRCSKTCKDYEWALRKGKKHDKKVENYIQLCKDCHTSYDNMNTKQTPTISSRYKIMGAQNVSYVLEVCGHRWGIQHKLKVQKMAKRWGVKDAEAFRRMIEEAK